MIELENVKRALASCKVHDNKNVIGSTSFDIDLVDLAESDLKAYMEREEWQPIETAPMDGSFVVLYGYFEKTFGVINDNPHEFRLGKWNNNFEEWVDSWDVGGFPATHWKPLPQPPKGQDDD